MAKLVEVKGDATDPQKLDAASKIVIPHVCNDKGGWGKGFVLALSKKWPEPEKAYRDQKDQGYQLGSVLFADAEQDVVVANMIAQRGTKWAKDGSPRGCPPIRYNALWDAMKEVAKHCKGLGGNVEIHCPKFGSDLAGGSWEVIECFIKALWVEEGIDVVVYEYEPPAAVAAPAKNGDAKDDGDIFDDM